MNKFGLIYDHVIQKLRSGLSEELTYHSIDHTLDVLKQSENIALAENITDEEELYLLKIAALYHDSGFLFIYQGHEARGCKIAKSELPAFGLSTEQIEIICGLIMATKIPQSASTSLQEVICDADLDYLGRDDYEVISNKLYPEFLKQGYVKNEKEWLEKQIGFFQSHHYYTTWAKEHRSPVKHRHLRELKSIQTRNTFK